MEQQGKKKVLVTGNHQRESTHVFSMMLAAAALMPPDVHTVNLRVDSTFKGEPGTGELSKQWNGAHRSTDHEFTNKGAKRIEKIPRNSVCNCGSGKKYKHCCGRRR